MARDIKDKKTIPLIPEPPKRGRPLKGSAPLTAAQRKSAQRKRDQAAVWSPADQGGLDIKEVTLTGLLEQMAKAVALGHDFIVRDIGKELVRRSKLNSRK